MSLIQAALDKTRAAQQRPSAPQRQAPPAKARPVHGPNASVPVMDESLERELREVQARYKKHQAFLWSLGIGALVIFFVFVGVLSAVVFHLRQDRGSIPDQNSSKPALAAAPKSEPSKTVSEEKYRPAPVRMQPSKTPYRLTGIMDLGGRRTAVINDEIVGVGERLPGGALVQAVGSKDVLLEMRGKKIRLQL